MDTRYNVLFAGELLEGASAADVRAAVARLFNADEATLDKLFSGRPQTIKRDCDRATAAKYKAALEKAGAKPIIKVAQEAAAPAPAPTSASAPASTKKQTAAEKIAALAAAADTQPAYGSAPAEPAETAPAPAAPPTPENDMLAPAGADVLRPEERAQPVVADVDTSGLILDAPVDRLAPEAAAPPPAPDTSHLDMGEVGDTIPTLPRHETPLNPDTDAISLTPEGTDLSDCARAEAEAPVLDLSDMNLAPTGSDVLEEQYRRRETATAPDTDHLSLDE